MTPTRAAPIHTRPLPQRRCIGCNTGADKHSLVRIVRNPEGRIEVDPAGKAAGRGAYLCSRPECWAAALKRNRIEQALRATLTPEDRSRLAEYAATLRNETSE